MGADIFGIPDLKIRLGDSEEVRQWNKLREAILTLANRPEKRPPPTTGPRRKGLEPYPINDGGTVGIGFWPGSVNFVKTGKRTTGAAGFESEDFVPTYNGTTLDSDPAPRVAHATGTFEAWMVYQEIENGSNPQHAARIVTAGLGIGPGAVRADEIATRFVIYDVVSSASSTSVRVVTQIESPTVTCPIVEHPFRMVRTGNEAWVSRPGSFLWPQGTASGANLVWTPVVVAAGSFTIAAAGTVWLEVPCEVSQQSESVVNFAASHVDVGFHGLKIASVGAATLSFQATPPAAGVNTTDEMDDGTVTVWAPIADFTHAGGVSELSHVYVSDTVWLPEIVDGEIYAV